MTAARRVDRLEQRQGRGRAAWMEAGADGASVAQFALSEQGGKQEQLEAVREALQSFLTAYHPRYTPHDLHTAQSAFLDRCKAAFTREQYTYFMALMVHGRGRA